MKKKRFNEKQIISILKEAESRIPVAQICRKHKISNSCFYNWKFRYSGMEVSELIKLKQLEEENKKLKQMYADISLDNQVLKDIIEKKL